MPAEAWAASVPGLLGSLSIARSRSGETVAPARRVASEVVAPLPDAPFARVPFVAEP